MTFSPILICKKVGTAKSFIQLSICGHELGGRREKGFLAGKFFTG